MPETRGTTRLWGAGRLWFYHKSNKEMEGKQNTYACRFRTFPAPDAPDFAVIGDTGTGDELQQEVANALNALIDERRVRLVLMVGDTVYNRSSGGSGDDDFEWLTTYFQPYRTIILPRSILSLYGQP